jgi:hypothetical protein
MKSNRLARLQADRAPRAALPAERAFVVQVRADADLAMGRIQGRVEHVISGAAARFESTEELVDCMRDALRDWVSELPTDSGKASSKTPRS